MKKLARQFTLIASLVLPFQATAAYQCQVAVQVVLIYTSGWVNVVHSGRGDYTGICSLTADYRGVSPSTCAMWTAMLQAIKKKNGTAVFYYDGTGSCETLPWYADAPVPVYIGDVTP